jgi:hypothetical protein
MFKGGVCKVSLLLYTRERADVILQEHNLRKEDGEKGHLNPSVCRL